MERFQEAREQALKNLKAADHILNVTYPVIQDTKLLLGAMDALFLSLAHSMSTLLHYEVFFKEIPLFNDHFETKFNLFLAQCPKHQIDKKYPELIRELRGLILLHRESKVEFRKKDRFVICSEDYSVTAVTSNQLKEYLKKSKEFYMIVDSIVGYERIFRRSERRIEAC